MRAAKKSTSKPEHQTLKCGHLTFVRNLPTNERCENEAVVFWEVSREDNEEYWEEGSSRFWAGCKSHKEKLDGAKYISKKEYLAGKVLES